MNNSIKISIIAITAIALSMPVIGKRSKEEGAKEKKVLNLTPKTSSGNPAMPDSIKLEKSSKKWWCIFKCKK